MENFAFVKRIFISQTGMQGNTATAVLYSVRSQLPNVAVTAF